ncbi:UDP-N-acetylmuramate dehydrogenase [Nesterenkonia lutea]|uniref:UDP-N-acetylenolpyruvoylglucosamine reductase n=1 Tax=Nesterenkonia lutea TaxID=272919 RepID=A0ABR9JAS9_9MICC|nr:UDP-N-acetylmuramate dehydrogenase [Nesterenkonia lutea]MBE1523024.1 UDP-N-acetylmuramate dehydrogenase [Nesterenkonia lutea]
MTSVDPSTTSSPRRFSDHTTARVGGPAGRWIRAESQAQAIEVLREHPLPDEDQREHGRDTLIVLGGGSNLLVTEDGFPGTVLQLAFTGIDTEEHSAGRVLLSVAAGHDWDDVVRFSVAHGLTGLEALSGIPGSTGAVPVQNVGAYGAEVAQTLKDVRAWDRARGELISFSKEQLRFGYRDSLLKQTTVHGSPRYVVLSVRFLLQNRSDGLSAPVRYGELARTLGLDAESADHERRAPLDQVRRTVLRLRAGKGMVLSEGDHDTWSTGSFFTNPIVPRDKAAALPADAPQFAAGVDDSGRPLVKLSAAWLIDHAGCGKGFGLPDGPEAGRGAQGVGLAGGRASLSTKHTLAVTNRGAATTDDLLAVARAARDQVSATFGITMHQEPVLIGHSL